VVANSARSARRFHEGVEDYETGEAHAERVIGLPAELQTPDGWRDGPGGKVYPRSGWPSDELLVACGGEIAELPPSGLRRREDLAPVEGSVQPLRGVEPAVASGEPCRHERRETRRTHRCSCLTNGTAAADLALAASSRHGRLSA
jgi:hypothetical protein